MNVYVVTELTNGETEPDEGEEGIRSCSVSFRELCDMINDGRIKDGPTIAAVGYLFTSGWLTRQHLA